jgi:hypothetical protein
LGYETCFIANKEELAVEEQLAVGRAVEGVRPGEPDEIRARPADDARQRRGRPRPPDRLMQGLPASGRGSACSRNSAIGSLDGEEEKSG